MLPAIKLGKGGDIAVACKHIPHVLRKSHKGLKIARFYPEGRMRGLLVGVYDLYNDQLLIAGCR
jgi:hypothetical protein